MLNPLLLVHLWIIGQSHQVFVHSFIWELLLVLQINCFRFQTPLISIIIDWRSQNTWIVLILFGIDSVFVTFLLNIMVQSWTVCFLFFCSSRLNAQIPFCLLILYFRLRGHKLWAVIGKLLLAKDVLDLRFVVKITFGPDVSLRIVHYARSFCQVGQV